MEEKIVVGIIASAFLGFLVGAMIMGAFFSFDYDNCLEKIKKAENDTIKNIVIAHPEIDEFDITTQIASWKCIKNLPDWEGEYSPEERLRQKEFEQGVQAIKNGD